MKCKHCGSEWTSTRSTTVCPFCQKPLAPADPKPQTLTDALVQIRTVSGPEVFGNGRALVSSFKDLAPGLKKEQTMLSYLEKCGGIAELYAVRGKSAGEQDLAVARVVCRMTDELMVNESAAKRVCAIYLQVLCGREQEEQARLEAEQKAREEAEKKAKQLELARALEAERKAKLEAEKKAKLEAEKKAKLEAEKKAKLEAEKKAKPDTKSKVNASGTTSTPVKHTTKLPFSDFFAALVWPTWLVAIALFIASTDQINTDGSFFLMLPIVLLMLWVGRGLVKKGNRIFGVFVLLMASTPLTVFYSELFPPEEATVYMLIVMAMCTVTAACSAAKSAAP